MKSIKQFSFLLAIAGLLLFGCGKDPDPGPKGDKGDKGDKGEKGDQGEQGLTGTANVMYSPWFKYSVEPRLATDFRFYYMPITVPQITGDFKNNGGIVLVYRGYSASGTPEEVGEIMNLPREGVQGFVNWTNSFRYEPGRVGIEYFVTGGMEYITSREDFLTRWSKSDKFFFRYVLIPGGELINGRKVSPVDYRNYQAVKAYYNIPD